MDNPIGRIGWTIVEMATGANDSGVTQLRLENASIEPHEITVRDELRQKKMREFEMANPSISRGPGGRDPDLMSKLQEVVQEIQEDPREELDQVVRVWFSKSLQLNESFIVGYAEHMRNNGGFGLTGNKVGAKFFSWEWFNFEVENEATKLQETGNLNFKKLNTVCGEEIVYMRFESDVSIRLIEFGTAVNVTPVYRINISKESEIYWPSLVDGKVVSNGFIEN